MASASGRLELPATTLKEEAMPGAPETQNKASRPSGGGSVSKGS
jgi:hypothetical protein